MFALVKRKNSRCLRGGPRDLINLSNCSREKRRERESELAKDARGLEVKLIRVERACLRKTGDEVGTGAVVGAPDPAKKLRGLAGAGGLFGEIRDRAGNANSTDVNVPALLEGFCPRVSREFFFAPKDSGYRGN